jgi:hypothetical protein
MRRKGWRRFFHFVPLMSLFFLVWFQPHISVTNSFHSGSANGLLLLFFLNFQSLPFLAKRFEWTWNLSHISFLSLFSFTSPVVFFLFGGFGGLHRRYLKTKRQGNICILLLSLYSRAKHFLSERAHTHTHQKEAFVYHNFAVFLFLFFLH